MKYLRAYYLMVGSTLFVASLIVFPGHGTSANEKTAWLIGLGIVAGLFAIATRPTQEAK